MDAIKKFARVRFMAAVVGVFLAFAGGGLAGTFFAGTLHHPSPAHLNGGSSRGSRRAIRY
jgi:hypothetical protein